VWSWNEKIGKLIAKGAYDAIRFLIEEVQTKWWFNAIWKWFSPLNVKLFFWLVLENKILTWDNLVKRGRNGPGRCALCNEVEEYVFHLTVS